MNSILSFERVNPKDNTKSISNKLDKLSWLGKKIKKRKNHRPTLYCSAWYSPRHPTSLCSVSPPPAPSAVPRLLCLDGGLLSGGASRRQPSTVVSLWQRRFASAALSSARDGGGSRQQSRRMRVRLAAELAVEEGHARGGGESRRRVELRPRRHYYT